MDFGRDVRIESVDFALPPDSSDTTSLLARLARRTGPPEVYVGGPTWGDRGNVGKIYPQGARPADYLKHYAQHFGAVELNATYYGVKPGSIERWATAVPDGFRFCPKLPMTISHRRRLRGAATETEAFTSAVRGFGSKLGPAWILLPPDFGPASLPALQEYVAGWPNDIPLAVELRDPGWFRDDAVARDVFQWMEATGTLSIISDVAGRRDVLHQRLTAPTAILRFAGNLLHDTDYSRLDSWVQRLREWFEQGLRVAYVFLHQPQEPLNVELAEFLARRFEAVCGLKIKAPQRVERYEQGTLF